MRSKTFIDPACYCPSRSKARFQAPEAKSTKTAEQEDFTQTMRIQLNEDQRDEWITTATVYSSSIETNDPDVKPIRDGEAAGQACEDPLRGAESAFARLHALPEDRQYIMRRFLSEESHELDKVAVESSQELLCLDEKIDESTMNSPPQPGETPSDPNLLMIGVFAEDFDEYDIYAQTQKSGSSANSIHCIRTELPTLDPEVLTKEYVAYESSFSKPYEKPDQLVNCSNSF